MEKEIRLGSWGSRGRKGRGSVELENRKLGQESRQPKWTLHELYL